MKANHITNYLIKKNRRWNFRALKKDTWRTRRKTTRYTQNAATPVNKEVLNVHDT